MAALLAFEKACKLSHKDGMAISEPLGCIEFAQIIVDVDYALGGGVRAARAKWILANSCDRGVGDRTDCLRAAYIGSSPNFGLFQEDFSRRYSALACQHVRNGSDPCYFANLWAAEDRRQAYYEGVRRRQAARAKNPSLGQQLNIMFQALGSASCGSSSSAATQYGEMKRRQDRARHDYVMDTYRKGSVNYGACATVNSPGC